MSRELNLLPPTRRQLLDNKLMLSIINRFMRMVLISLSAVFVIGLITVIMLQAMILTSSSSVEDNLQRNIDRYQEVREEIAQKNNVIQIMHTANMNRIVWSDYFQSLFQTLPPNTTIVRMAGSTVDRRRMEFSGTAANRNALIVLEDRLSGLEWVDDVIAPRSNLLERENPTYRFDLIIGGAEARSKEEE